MTISGDDLRALAGRLAPTFPCCDDAPLALVLLSKLAQGSPVDVTSVARATGRNDSDVRDILARWPNVHRNDEQRVLAFSGLSIVPTPHRFEMGDRRLYTWCAWDTLFLPALLGREARVASKCPVTGRDVALSIAPGGVGEAGPDDLLVSFPPPEQASTADITASFCCHVHFLAGGAAAERWRADHDGGLTLTLADAYELGRLATQCFDTTGAAR